MKIISWNINGLRAVIKKGFKDYLKEAKPDVLCLQEIKIDKEAIHKEQFDFSDYKEFYNSAERKGYSGTAILVKESISQAIQGLSLREACPRGFESSDGVNNPVKDAPVSGLPRRRFAPPRNDKVESWKNVIMLLPKLKWDDEGRVQVIDLGKFYLANVYFPNANHELSRLDFKIKFNDKLLKYFKSLEEGQVKITKQDKTDQCSDLALPFCQGGGQEGVCYPAKPVIICGDYNVAHQEIDLARPKENVGNPGFHPRERAWMDKFLKSGFVDIWRSQHPKDIKYTWWSYRANARARNVGWRIDYFCCSEKFIKNITKSFIDNSALGSDHCPVGIRLK